MTIGVFVLTVNILILTIDIVILTVEVFILVVDVLIHTQGPWFPWNDSRFGGRAPRREWTVVVEVMVVIGELLVHGGFGDGRE